MRLLLGLTNAGQLLLAPQVRVVVSRALQIEVDSANYLSVGVSAKVSTKLNGKSDSTHVVCVYAQNFDDQADVKRILKELVRLSVAAAVPGPLIRSDRNAQKQIYFKADAYTWLDIMGDNEYKLKASMYSTASLLTKEDVVELR